MNFLNSWAGVVAAFIFAAALFAYSAWSRSLRRKAGRSGDGLDVWLLGRSFIGFGLLMGASCPFFGEVPPEVSWRSISVGALLGAGAGLLVAHRMTTRWDAALRENRALPPRVERWWASRWAILGFVALLLVVSLAFPRPVAAFADSLGGFGGAIGYLLSGFFLAGGLGITLWAAKRAREYGRPIKLPHARH